MDALRLRFEGRLAVPSGIEWDADAYVIVRPRPSQSEISDLIEYKGEWIGYQAAWADAVKECNQDAARYQYLKAHPSFNLDKGRLEWYLPRSFKGGGKGFYTLDETIDMALLAPERKGNESV